MSNTRNLSNLLDSNGDVKATHLDNAPTPTKSEIEGLGIAASSLTGALPAISGANLTGILTAVTLDSPSISGTLSVDSGSNVTHTIGNWSEELNYTITPTNCTVGSINASGEFIVTHTSGVPSYTIKATTDNLGLDDSSLVTKNLVVKLTAPTISSPADTPVTTNVVYTVTSTDSGDDKIILDMGTSNFTYQSVDVGSGSKVGNTVEVTGFTTGNPAITVQFTALGTYASVKAKSTNIAGTYGDSNYSSSDSIVCYEQLSAPSLNAPADSDDATAVTYTISSIDSNATKVIFDAQSSNFTYGSVGSGSGSKVGNTVEITGWSGTSVTVTLTYTTAATYSNRANVTSTSATYTDSAYSSSDSIIISASYAFQGSNYGFCCTGRDASPADTNIIDKYSFSSDGDATDVGDASLSRVSVGGCSSATNAYWSGGRSFTAIDKLSFTSGVNSSDIGDCTTTHHTPAGASSENNGYIMAGESGYIVIDKISFSTDGNGTDIGDLSSTRNGPAGQSSTTHGYTSGGHSGPGGVFMTNVDKISFSSDGNGTDVGDITVAKYLVAGQSSTTHGYTSGGASPSTQHEEIDKYSFSSEGTATDVGNLTVGRQNVSGTSSTDSGYTANGHTDQPNTDVIDKFSFSSDGNATDVGNLTVGRYGGGGCQY